MNKVSRLHLEMGYFCNVRCIMCYQHNYTKKLPEFIWRKKLLPVYKDLEELIIQGGEVTVMPEVKELITLVKKNNKNIKFGVLTNGLLFDDDWQNEFVENGFMVNFSLNAATEKTYKKMCQQSDFSKVMVNLKNLIQKRNKESSNLQIFISLVIWQDNVSELADFIRLGKRLGVDKVRFFMDRNNLAMDKETVTKSVGEAWRTYDQKKIKVEGLASFYTYYCCTKKIKNIYSERKDDTATDTNCVYPWVEHTGEVKGCCNVESVLGDLNKNSFEEIWNNRRAKEFRGCLAKGDFSRCLQTCSMVKNPKYGWSLSGAKMIWEKYWYKFRKNPKEIMGKIPKKVRGMVMVGGKV